MLAEQALTAAGMESGSSAVAPAIHEQDWCLEQFEQNGVTRYAAHVDLAASFIARHRHHIGLASFVCVGDATTAAGVAALVRQVLSHGRLVWCSGLTNAERAFWTKSFFEPLENLKMLSPQGWVTEPVSVLLADLDLHC